MLLKASHMGPEDLIEVRVGQDGGPIDQRHVCLEAPFDLFTTMNACSGAATVRSFAPFSQHGCLQNRGSHLAQAIHPDSESRCLEQDVHMTHEIRQRRTQAHGSKRGVTWEASPGSPGRRQA